MLLTLAFLGTFGIVVSIALLLFYREDLMERLQTVVEPDSASSWVRITSKLQRRQHTVETITKPFQNMLPRSAEESSVVQKRLTRAGYRHPNALNVFYGAKVLVPILLTVFATVTGVYEWGPLFIYGLSIGLGFLAPDFWLGNRIKTRQRRIKLGLPEALDLMVICTESGLGMDQALARVASELKISQPEIRDELLLMGLEQKAGHPREQALKNLADRVDLPTMRALTTTLIQADQFGTSVAKTLRVYSDTLRTQRRQEAEEVAAKTTVKLVFPLVFFIFPSIFVVALGPAAISLWEGMEKAFGP
jgi:tight adherence protein C